jgi:hypothetical protein
MNFRVNIILILLLIAATRCEPELDPKKLLPVVEQDIKTGNLKLAIKIAGMLKEKFRSDSIVFYKADSLEQIAERIPLDFSLDEKQVTEKLKNIPGGISIADKIAWEKNGWLECRRVNGQKKYFNRAVSNLELIRDFNLTRNKRDSSIAAEESILWRKTHTGEIIKSTSLNGDTVLPVRLKIDFTITLEPDAVPAGEVVRCWLPYPKENMLRQKNIMLISASQPEYQISPDSAIHRSVYMEAISEKHKPLVFNISYNYTSYGQYFDLNEKEIKAYNKNSSLYKKYTAEQQPQINFNSGVRHLADSITGNETNPYEIVRKIYYWFNKNIPWAGAQEYSIMSDIPGYVIENKHGDCGMQTFLLMSMLRYKGIPVRWESGWMVPPGNKNLHDWCEVYYEGIGWVPADVSYQLQYSENKKTREFYISGIDSYRLIINDGVAGRFYPEKKFLRSEPFDFQRGELEWRGGNLYFDKWDYHMSIEYIENQNPSGLTKSE